MRTNPSWAIRPLAQLCLLFLILFLGATACFKDLGLPCKTGEKDCTHQVVCGDGLREEEEECDDGNEIDDDECHNDCVKKKWCGDGTRQLDLGEECDPAILPSGENYRGPCTDDCKLKDICGDGILGETEECDDGNETDNDECPNNCSFAICGNGLTEGQEQCDDGNEIDTDDCRNDCTLAASCGDGMVQEGEECDDGNTQNDDGCDGSCKISEGFLCGDGIVSPDEECDDGNDTNGDGCELDCTLTPSLCGNGRVNPPEECDDGNDTNGDGCENDCLISVKTVTLGESDLGLDIIDDGYQGLINTMVCHSLNFEDDGFNQVIDIQLTVGIQHSAVGDLVIALVDPEFSILTVMSRPGFSELTNNGDDGGMNDSNISFIGKVTFRQDAPLSAELMGINLDDNEVVCLTDSLCDYAPNPGAGPGKDFSDFIGKTSIGAWSVCVGDADLLGTGTLESVELTLTKQFTP